MLNKFKSFFLKIRWSKKKGVHFHREVLIDKYSTFDGGNTIFRNANLCSSKIGFGTYVGPHSVLDHCLIGRFSSISQNVSLVWGGHPISSFVSTSPAFYQTDFPKKCNFHCQNRFKELPLLPNGFAASIGNDVWIGQNVLIKAGVTVGDGSIIGMGAVVVSDVPPYSIVGGCPAKVIRMRFNQEEIAAFLRIKWWNWDVSQIEKRSSDFSDPISFLKKYDR